MKADRYLYEIYVISMHLKRWKLSPCLLKSTHTQARYYTDISNIIKKYVHSILYLMAKWILEHGVVVMGILHSGALMEFSFSHFCSVVDKSEWMGLMHFIMFVEMKDWISGLLFANENILFCVIELKKILIILNMLWFDVININLYMYTSKYLL